MSENFSYVNWSELEDACDIKSYDNLTVTRILTRFVTRLKFILPLAVKCPKDNSTKMLVNFGKSLNCVDEFAQLLVHSWTALKIWKEQIKIHLVIALFHVSKVKA